MKYCFLNIMARILIANVLLLLILVLNNGCSAIKSPTPKAHETKPLVEKIGKYYQVFSNAEELKLEMEISSQITISQKTPEIFVSYLKANLKIIPINDNRQKILSLEIMPPGKYVDHSLEFQLDYPSPGGYEFKIKTELILKNEWVQVMDKIAFPLQDIPEDQIKYMKPSLIIDSDDEELRALASSISQGEDDLYRVVLKTSKWVTDNVQTAFDNSTIFISQKASWVLGHRKGVCDEKTNIFIGLLRSLGIPAKFITGFAGVKYNGEIHFKSHGWAEVYFPSIGWIPFDVAFNQLGFIDVTHIKLSESVDTSEPFISYEWESVDISEDQTSDKEESDHALVTINDLRIKTWIKQVKRGRSELAPF